MSSALFSPIDLRGLSLPNRIVVSPMCQYSARDGNATDWHLMHLGQLAISGSALVIVEATAVEPRGRITPNCLGLYTDENEAALAHVLEFCRRHGDAKMGIQLGHAGRKASSHTPADGRHPLSDEEGAWQTVAPSPIPTSARRAAPHALTPDELMVMANSFVAAAIRAERLGFDLIELHMAHGYLLSTFLSPLANRRADAYGGPIENRMRFPLEVFAAVRAAWPQDKPISARISATDWKAGGFSASDGLALVAALKAAGCDIVDVSTGQVVGDQQPQYGRLWQLPFSTRLRLEGGLPTMAIGNIQSFGDANAIIAGGRADLCVLARMHLADPYWTRHAAYEYGWDLPWPNPYASVNLPYTPRWS